MKSYTITIPAFTLSIPAKTKKEALEQFWFDYDLAQEYLGCQRPIISVTKK